MAFTPKKSLTVVSRYEFFVPDGSTMKDLSDAMRHVIGQLEAAGKRTDHDDAFHVKAADEGIVLYFEKEQQG